MTNVCAAIVRFAVRGDVDTLAATLYVTLPPPVPVVVANVTQLGAFDTFQPHEAPVVTATLPVPPAAVTERAAGEIE
jgi:hypothetical protein